MADVNETEHAEDVELSRREWDALNEPTAPAVFRSDAFAGRVYGVTGAGQSIGEALANALARCGGRVVLVDRNDQQLRRVGRDIQAIGGEVQTVLGDVAEPAIIERAIDRAYEKWGRVDGWVNNAPANPQTTLAEQTAEQAHYAWQVNVEAARRAMQRLIPIMTEQKAGVILNVSSILAHQARACDTIYAGTKGALEALTRAWAIELAAHGIRVNCVQPGATSLPFVSDGSEWANLRRRAFWARVRALEPRQQPVVPRDVANAMVFLLSDAAAGITGAMLPVDGGQSVDFRDMREAGRAEAAAELRELRNRIDELERGRRAAQQR